MCWCRSNCGWRVPLGLALDGRVGSDKEFLSIGMSIEQLLGVLASAGGLRWSDPLSRKSAAKRSSPRCRSQPYIRFYSGIAELTNSINLWNGRRPDLSFTIEAF